MIQEIKKGHTLLIKGPARVEVLEGKFEIFGMLIDSKDKKIVKKFIVPEANVYPFYAVQKGKLEIFSPKKENITEIKENSIIDEWIEIKDKVIEDIKNNKNNFPLKIMVLGISTGKTTLIKYLANSFLREGLKGGYLDSDLGQQLIYLPTTLNIGEIEGPILASEDIITEDTVFIGATFPKGNFKYTLAKYCKNMMEKYVERHKDTDFILIDTDGWVKQGETSINYKNFFIDTVDPDVIIVFHDDEIEELKAIEENAKKRADRKIYLIKEQNKYFYEKDKEERRFLRQSQFARVLEQFRKITIPLNDIKFIKSDYDKENDEIIEVEIPVEELERLPYHYVICALLTDDSELIKIALLFYINIEKDYILLFSDINYKEQMKIKKILLGSLRLSTKGNFQGYLYL
ncbi:MAG: Clp1/GlmU family protein [Promethearchaeota archaeon]